MSEFEVNVYNIESGISKDVAEQVAGVFERNYPLSHPEANRVDDIAAMSSTVIAGSLHQGDVFYVASEEGQVAGFIKARTVDVQGGAYEQLSWIMTDSEYRGRRLASLLHRSFIIDATLRSILRMPTPTLALLSVHEQNSARAIYEHWGYSVTEEAGSGKVFMTMKLPAEG